MIAGSRVANALRRQVQLFLNSVDESALTAAFLDVLPDLWFVDGDRWPNSSPPRSPTIPGCRSGRIFLWDSTVAPLLPARPRPDGTWQGPAVGPVAELTRCVEYDGVLRSGRLAVSYSGGDPKVDRMLAAIWRVVEKFTVDGLDSLGGRPAPEYRVGPATSAAHAERGLRLRDRSVEVFFSVRAELPYLTPEPSPGADHILAL